MIEYVVSAGLMVAVLMTVCIVNLTLARWLKGYWLRRLLASIIGCGSVVGLLIAADRLFLTAHDVIGHRLALYLAGKFGSVAVFTIPVLLLWIAASARHRRLPAPKLRQSGETEAV